MTEEPFSLDSTLAHSRLNLNLSLDIDRAPILAQDLIHSAFPAAVQNWLTKHQSSLAIDRVNDPKLSSAEQEPSTVIIPVVSYSRTSLSRSLSTNPTLDPLKSLSLSFSLKSPVSASQEGSASLLDQALSTPLPFFLVSLVSEALTLFAKKAVKFLPLVFNPISIDRLSNDLASHASIAASLANILLRQPTQDSSTQTAASLKLFQLKDHLRPPHATPASTPPTVSEEDDAKTLVTALLLRGIKTHPPDAFRLPDKRKRRSKATKAAEDALDAVSDDDDRPADTTPSSTASSAKVAAIPGIDEEERGGLSGDEDDFEELSGDEEGPASGVAALVGGTGQLRRTVVGQEDDELLGFDEEAKVDEGGEMLWDGLDEEEEDSGDEELEMGDDAGSEGTQPQRESGERAIEEVVEDDLMHDLW